MFGCSCFVSHTKDDRHLLARTMEFAMDPGNKVVIIPRDFSLFTRIDADERVQARFATVGMGFLYEGRLILQDGVNQQGLMGALLYYPRYACYRDAAEPGTAGVQPSLLIPYILSQCGSIDEAESALRKITLLNEKGFEGLGTPPLHYIFSDASGNTLVAEPDKAGLSIYRDTVGVLTNSPEYPWHETNLNNYVGLRALQPPSANFSGKSFSATGQGAGTIGLPGDYTPPSRFVRIAFLSQHALQAADENEGVTRAMHVLASVDIPLGVVQEADQGYDHTYYTSCVCAESGRYYFHTYGCRRIACVSLGTQADSAKELTIFEVPDRQDILQLN